MDSKPTLGPIRRYVGIADQVAYNVDVTYPGEPTSTVQFVGSVQGGPVVMITPGNPDGVFVSDPERFGTFGPGWAVRFFA